MNDPRLQKYAVAPALKGAIAGIAASVVLGVGDSKLSLGGGLVRPDSNRPERRGRLHRERA